MGDIIDLDAHRAHLTISVGTTIHVFPVSCMLDVASGKLPLETLEPDVWRRILVEWLEFVKDNQ